MTEQEIYEKIKAVVVEQLGVSESEVSKEASFVEDLGADSLDSVELLMALEEEFGTEISDEDSEKLKTISDTITYIKGKVK